MHVKERFEYRGYVIDVRADHHESGEWSGSYLILKNGDQLLPGGTTEIGVHETIAAAQNHAIKEARKKIDVLIGKDAG